MRDVGLEILKKLAVGAVCFLSILASDDFAHSAPMLPNPLIPIAGVVETGVGDFNSDGRVDLVTCNRRTNNVSVLLGVGDGSFGPERRFNVGSAPVAVAVADFDGNGTQDLAIANQDSANVSILLGVGDGTFGPEALYGAGPSPSSIAAGDFDRDGRQDLVVANAVFSGEVSVLLNSGDATFGDPTAFPAGMQPQSVAVGDFNGDEHLDVAAANFAGSIQNETSTVSIFLGLGNGTLAPSLTYGVGIHPIAVAVGDFNRDGSADLTVADAGSGIPQGIQSDVSILFGRGDGTFLERVRYQSGDGPTSVAVGDFNGDGVQDLAVANVFDGLSIFIGRGDASFAAPLNTYVGVSPFRVVMADFNADGKQDLAMTNTSETVNVTLGAGDGTFGVRNPAADVLGASSLASGDLNGDAITDLVAGYANGGIVSVIPQSGPGAFGSVTTVPAGPNPSSVLLEDLNADGYLDLVVSNRTSPGVVSVRLGHGDGTFDSSHNFDAGTALPKSLAVADLNGDGRPDLAAGGGAYVGLLIGIGGGSFAPAVSILAARDDMVQVAFSDLNGDGLQDLVVSEVGSVSVLLGSGGVSFGTRRQFTAGVGSARFAIADLNHDGHGDLAVANSGSNDVLILLGRGNGIFDPAGRFAVGQGPSNIGSADINGDGRLDLAVTNANSHDLSLLLGNGDATFGRERRFLTPLRPVALQTEDFDANGTVDLAVSGDFSDVWLLLNQTTPSDDHPPVADAGADIRDECTSFDGAVALLDGSGSTDPDSSAGTNDDIVSFEWFENYALPTQQNLGSGETLSVELPLGGHSITLKVTDSAGMSDTAVVMVTVVDSTPPAISMVVNPSLLWPPNHALVPVTVGVRVQDLCDPNPAVVLVSVTSSEPDDAPGGDDGTTAGDIQGADVGSADFDFQLRAERDAGEEGRGYRVTYLAMDSSGNQAQADSLVFVPHDQGGSTEPVLISADAAASVTFLRWDPVPGALTYKVIRGDVGALRESGGFIDLGTVFCIQSAPASVSTEDADVPSLGEAFFYLASYNDGRDSGYGSASAAKPRISTAGGCEFVAPTRLHVPEESRAVVFWNP